MGTTRRQQDDELRRSEARARAILETALDCIITMDHEGKIVEFNPAAEQTFGYARADVIGRELADCIVPAALREAHRKGMAHYLATGEGPVLGKRIELPGLRADGSEFPVELAITRIPVDGPPQFTAYLRDMTDQKRADAHRTVRLAVTRALSEAESEHAGASGALQAVCEQLGWDAGVFWKVDGSGKRLVYKAGWHAADLRAQEFDTACRERTFEKGDGLPGRAWSTGALVSAVEDGLHTGVACPVAGGGRMLGVFELFTRGLREADADLAETMGTVAGNVGQFIERKVAEDELRQSEHELADFFENATIGLHWVGADGTILRANRAELQMLGYTRDEYVGRPVAQFHADADVIGDMLTRLRAGENLNEYPARLRCSDGSIKDVLIDSSGRFKDGEFVHTRCFTRDVTERRRAEADARRQEARSTTILESIPEAFCTLDHEWRFTYVNRQAEVLLGRSRGDLLGKNHWEEYPGSLGTIVETEYRRVLAQNESTRFELFFAPHERWYEIHAFPSRDGLSIYFRDVSQRRRADSALRESEEKLRLMADTIPQLAWMAQPDGFIFWYNRRWYEYTGTTPERMEGWGWQSVHDPEALPAVMERWTASIASGEPFDMVFPIKGADDRFRPFLTRVNPLRDDGGRILYWFGTNTDISDIKRMEDALRDADRRKDEFLATLAHELRNPLAPILNSLHVLKLPRVNAAAAEQTRQVMERQVHHLVRLVDDLLDVSRVMRGKIELRKERIALASVIAHAVETAHPLIALQAHRLEVSLPSEPLLLDADHVRLAQVIGNLLTNSAKYTEPNGHIQLTAYRDGSQAVLRVRDDGIGIAPAMLPQVFDLFVQVDHTSTKAQGGLGIGLTLVRNLVEMHGGVVEARSAGLGQGSEFIVRLPIAAQGGDDPRPQETAGDGLPEPVRRSGHRLLIVDDNEDAAESLGLLLQLQGHEVRVAHSGPAALEIAKDYVPHLVFLDLGMPAMDGYEVARRLRQIHDGSVVLAALTGWGHPEDRRKTADAGFDHHLVKPAAPEAIATVLAGLRQRQ